MLPTDTVYGLGADAFDPAAVARLLAAKGRGREMPPPVLVGSPTTLDALAVRRPEWARALVEQFWPGPLTMVVPPAAVPAVGPRARPAGRSRCGCRDHQVALELLARTGPLAVSSANLTGQPAATDADAGRGDARRARSR